MRRIAKAGGVFAGAAMVAACNLPPEEITTPTDYPVPTMRSVGETPSSVPGKEPGRYYRCAGAVLLKEPRLFIVSPIMDLMPSARAGMAPADFRPRYDSATKRYTFNIQPAQAVEAKDMVLYDASGKDIGSTSLACVELDDAWAVAVKPKGTNQERLVLTNNPEVKAQQEIDLSTPAAVEVAGVFHQEFSVPLNGEDIALKQLTDSLASSNK